MFAVSSAFACFHHAEHVLSAIAKLGPTCLPPWGGEKRGEMGRGRDRGREWSENAGRVLRGGKSECAKIAPKRNRFGIWGRPLGLPPRVIHFRKHFSGTTFPSQIVYLNLVSFRRYFIFKVDNTRKIFKNLTYLAFWGSYNRLPSQTIHF